MRIWDLDPKYLCGKHLLAEHRELHAIWNIITKKKKGYSKHPETKRWKGKLQALYQRHEKLVKEFEKRKYSHRSPLNKKLAIGKAKQDLLIDSIAVQKQKLKNKPCKCFK